MTNIKENFVFSFARCERTLTGPESEANVTSNSASVNETLICFQYEKGFKTSTNQHLIVFLSLPLPFKHIYRHRYSLATLSLIVSDSDFLSDPIKCRTVHTASKICILFIYNSPEVCLMLETNGLETHSNWKVNCSRNQSQRSVDTLYILV